MKKIFSVLVVAFFLAATLVLVPQSNYFALAQEEQEEEEQLGDDFNNIKTRVLEQTSKCTTSNCSRIFYGKNINCRECQSDGTCQSICGSAEECNSLAGGACVKRSCRYIDCKAVCGGTCNSRTMRCINRGCIYPYKCNSTTGQCYL